MKAAGQAIRAVYPKMVASRGFMHKQHRSFHLTLLFTFLLTRTYPLHRIMSDNIKRNVSDAAPADRAFPFLDLPAELRNKIYKYAVAGRIYHTDTVVGFFHRNEAHLQRPAKIPPITQVSRQIRGESLPLYFSENELLICMTTMENYYTFRRWLLDMHPRCSSWLNRVTISAGRYYSYFDYRDTGRRFHHRIWVDLKDENVPVHVRSSYDNWLDELDHLPARYASFYHIIQARVNIGAKPALHRASTQSLIRGAVTRRGGRSLRQHDILRIARYALTTSKK
ncbi:hypothetical protein BJ546DRAFT_433414 [Cryomyces antarcticus]